LQVTAELSGRVEAQRMKRDEQQRNSHKASELQGQVGNLLLFSFFRLLWVMALLLWQVAQGLGAAGAGGKLAFVFLFCLLWAMVLLLWQVEQGIGAAAAGGLFSLKRPLHLLEAVVCLSGCQSCRQGLCIA